MVAVRSIAEGQRHSITFHHYVYSCWFSSGADRAITADGCSCLVQRCKDSADKLSGQATQEMATKSVEAIINQRTTQAFKDRQNGVQVNHGPYQPKQMLITRLIQPS